LLLEGKPRWSGLDVVLLDKYAAAFNIPQKAGLLVQRVAQGSMADEMGLKGGDKLIKIGTRELLIGGDVILEVAGIIVTPDAMTLKAIRKKIQQMDKGDTLFVKVLRAGETKDLSAKLQ